MQPVESSEAQPLVLPFRAPDRKQRLSGAVLCALLGALVGALVALRLPDLPFSHIPRIAIPSTLAAVPAAAVWLWWCARIPRDRCLVIDGRGVSAPRYWFAHRSTRIDFADIIGFFQRGPVKLPWVRGDRGALHIGIAGRFAMNLELRWLEGTVSRRGLAARVRAGIRALPDGAQRLAVMQRADALLQEVRAHRSPLGIAIAVLLMVVAVQTLFFALPYHPEWDIYAHGGASRWLVREGGGPRFASAVLLSGSISHAGLNGLVTWLMFRVLEPMVGGARTLFVYLASALLGIAASVVFSPESIVVGASGGVYGILAFFLMLRPLRPEELPVLYRWPWPYYALILLPAFALENVTPGVSAAGHLGGAAAAVALTPLVLRGVPQLGAVEGSAAARAANAALLIAIFVGALWFYEVLGDGPAAQKRRAAAALLRESALTQSDIELAAPVLAYHRAATREELERILPHLRRWEAATGLPSDVRPIVNFRLGHTEDALDEAQRYLADVGGGYADVFATMEWMALRAGRARSAIGSPLGVETPSLLAGEPAQLDLAALLDDAIPSREPLELHLVAEEDGRPVGLLRLRVPAGLREMTVRELGGAGLSTRSRMVLVAAFPIPEPVEESWAHFLPLEWDHYGPELQPVE